MNLTKIYQYLQWLAGILKNNSFFSQEIMDFMEDIEATLESFTTPSSIQHGRDITQYNACVIYSTRFIKLCESITSSYILNPSQINGLKDCMTNIYSYGFVTKNDDNPHIILFSQNRHNSIFSSQSDFFSIHGETITKAAQKLSNGDYLARNFPVRVFYAEYKEELQCFTVNNRTYATLSRAGLQPARIIPVLPTKDHLERLNTLNVRPIRIKSESDDETEVSAIRGDSKRSHFSENDGKKEENKNKIFGKTFYL